jgi:CO/xanthine dehydrogenase Mo-binding subunit
MAAVANAIHRAIGVRLYSLPMSPPKILEALEPEPLAKAAD